MARDTTKNIGDFPGMMQDVDPQDIPDGASVVQVNLTSKVYGQLETRRGFRFANFDSTTLVASLVAD